VNVLRDAGVTVSAGGDNIQDPFNPVGRGDALETANLLVVAAHVNPESAFDAVSADAHRSMNSLPDEVAVGSRANFVGLRATTVREAIAMGPPDRIVVHGGIVLPHQYETESKH
jgi:cytosine deaminase